MSSLKNVDLSQFISNKEIRIENVDLENCVVSEIPNRILVICRCCFKNVTFENSFDEVYATFKECEFTECVFHDTFAGEDLELVMQDNIFINCVFENISYRSFQAQSNVVNCKFDRCKFINIIIEGDLSLIGLEMKNGKINNFSFYGNQIMQNYFSDLQIANMNLKCAFMKNKLERIDLRDVKIDGYCKDNFLIECEPSVI